MSLLKIEPFSGVSGDMFLGALVDLGGDVKSLRSLPKTLGFSDVSVAIDTADKCGIQCTNVTILDQAEPVVRHLSDIVDLIGKAQLPPPVKAFSLEVFSMLGAAEAAVHGVPVEKIHFHEVGAVDSILDIVGTALLLAEFKIDEVIATPVCTGSGFVHCAHGKFPVPAPATASLLHGMPTFAGDIAAEMTTPTGAAILKALDPSFSSPIAILSDVGYGAGDRDLEQPNCLRLSVGQLVSAVDRPVDQIWVIQANLDDISGELLGGRFQELLLNQGALDWSLSPVMMKKGRPGHRLEVLCRKHELQALADLIMMETTTIGVRFWEVDRQVLARSVETVETSYGTIRLKCVVLPSGKIRKTPEYEDCRRCADQSNAPLQDVMRAALAHCSAE